VEARWSTPHFSIDKVHFVFHIPCMDWDLAIERNREPLLRTVMELFDRIGLTETAMVERLSRPLYWSVLLVLRTAEAAVRRLIVVAAHNIVVKPRKRRPAPKGLKIPRKGNGQSKRRASFKLFDPPKRSRRVRRRKITKSKVEPRIHVFAYDPRIPEPLRSHFATTTFAEPAAPAPHQKQTVDKDTVNAGPLCRRLFAIKYALEDLQRQAKRLARWWANPIEERRPRRETPLRPGSPPGFRKKQIHEVDDILLECNFLARTLPAPDTS
jgi:hypothetical protein